MVRWDRYWFAEGGRLAAAVLRVAIGVAVLCALHRLDTHWPSTAPGGGAHAIYRPVGIWMVFGHLVPADGVVSLLWVIAWASGVAMLLGAWSRIATAVSLTSFLALASLSYSGGEAWSHPYNPILLAQVAFLGARGGDALSVDALIRHVRGLPPVNVARGYQWSIRLVQLAVALVFLSGMVHKLAGAGFTLKWITTDNLRNQILLRYDIAGAPHPAIVDWILADVWRYRTTAALSMISQTLPIFACVFVKRPVLRALCGAAFVMETIGLAVVMQYWNLEWVPLAVVFVDWDALLAKIKPLPATPAEGRPPRAAKIFVIGFVVFDLATTFLPQVDQKLNTYPFTRFAMFAKLRVDPPYDEHLPYSIPAGHFEIVSDPPINPALLDSRHRSLYLTKSKDDLRARLVAIFSDVRRMNPDAKVSALRLYVAVLEVPAYPGTPLFVPRDIALLAEVTTEGGFTCKLDTAADAVTYYLDDSPEPHADPIKDWSYQVARDGWVVKRR